MKERVDRESERESEGESDSRVRERVSEGKRDSEREIDTHHHLRIQATILLEGDTPQTGSHTASGPVDEPVQFTL